MPLLIISSASRSSPRIFIYHSSHIILIPSSFHSIILAFFTFPLIHFTMVLFAISSKLIFSHFIYHTQLFIIPSSFPFISPPSPSSPLIFVIHFYSHPCSLSIHFHAFPSHSSSYPFQSHSLLSISIPITPFPFIFPIHSQFLYDLSLSLHQWYSTLHSASLTLISSILSLPSYTYHSSLFFAAHLRFPTTRSIPCLFG